MKILNLKRELEKYPNHAEVGFSGVAITGLAAERQGNLVMFSPIHQSDQSDLSDQSDQEE